MNMTDLFKKHIEKFIVINEEEFSEVLSFFQVEQVQKKQNVMVEGQVCKYHYFVLKGCLRKFFVNEKGIEQTTEFAIENWWITDILAYQHKSPTKSYIQA